MKPSLASLFGSSAEVARIAGVDRAAVTRWSRYAIAPTYQKRLIREARRQKLPIETVAKVLGVDRCPACGTFHIGKDVVR